MRNEICQKCKHKMMLHHFADTKDKQVFVCDGESLPCFCVSFMGDAKEMYEKLRDSV